MARKIKQTLLEKRTALILQADADLRGREAAALAALHPGDRQDAQACAVENARDTMADKGMPKAPERSFAFRRAYVATLAMLADCAPDYGYRRA